jgi:hypothetical protein
MHHDVFGFRNAGNVAGIRRERFDQDYSFQHALQGWVPGRARSGSQGSTCGEARGGGSPGRRHGNFAITFGAKAFGLYPPMTMDNSGFAAITRLEE